MKDFFITFNYFLFFIIKKKWSFIAFIFSCITFSILYSLKVSPLYTAELSFTVDNSYNDWWLYESSEINLFNLSSYRNILQKDDKAKIKGMIESDQMILDFLKSNNFDENSYYSKKQNISENEILNIFKLNSGIGKDRLTDIFYITLKDRTQILAEKNLNNFFNYTNKIIVDKEVKKIEASIKKLNISLATSNDITFRKEIYNKISENLLAKKLIELEIKKPLKVIEKAYSSVFRTYPKRGNTVIFLTWLSGFAFLIFFIPFRK